MKEIKNKSIFKLLTSVTLITAIFLLTVSTANIAQAASKPSIDSKYTMGTGSIWGNEAYYFKSDKYTLDVNNPVKKATYSFTSSNNKVVTVKTSGTKANLTGVKAGTATITCNQKLNGKTTKVGVCTVTVKNVTFNQRVKIIPIGTSTNRSILYVNRNNNATYTFTSNSKDLTVKETLEKSDAMGPGMNIMSQTFNAKKAGTYTVTIKETYNKVTRTVGKVKYTVNNAKVYKETTMEEGEVIGAFSLIDNCRQDVPYLFVADDNKIIESYTIDDNFYIKANKAGTGTIKIYENAKSINESKLIGTCKITVNEVVLEAFEVNFSETATYVGGDDIEVEAYKEPSHAPGTITINSSDIKVATVKINEDGYGIITPVGAGTTTITVACGDFTETKTITVYADEDEYYENN
jgi:hypothetical protein